MASIDFPCRHPGHITHSWPSLPLKANHMIYACEQYCQWCFMHEIDDLKRYPAAPNLRKHARCHIKKDSPFTIQSAGKGGGRNIFLEDDLVDKKRHYPNTTTLDIVSDQGTTSQSLVATSNTTQNATFSSVAEPATRLPTCEQPAETDNLFVPQNLPPSVESITGHRPVDAQSPARAQSLSSVASSTCEQPAETDSLSIPQNLPSSVESITGQRPVDTQSPARAHNLSSPVASITSERPVDTRSPARAQSLSSVASSTCEQPAETDSLSVPQNLPSVESITGQRPVDEQNLVLDLGRFVPVNQSVATQPLISARTPVVLSDPLLDQSATCKELPAASNPVLDLNATTQLTTGQGLVPTRHTRSTSISVSTVPIRRSKRRKLI